MEDFPFGATCLLAAVLSASLLLLIHRLGRRRWISWLVVIVVPPLAAMLFDAFFVRMLPPQLGYDGAAPRLLAAWALSGFLSSLLLQAVILYRTQVGGPLTPPRRQWRLRRVGLIHLLCQLGIVVLPFALALFGLMWLRLCMLLFMAGALLLPVGVAAMLPLGLMGQPLHRAFDSLCFSGGEYGDLLAYPLPCDLRSTLAIVATYAVVALLLATALLRGRFARA